MNLRVDLILESEQRSASLLNVKSLTRIGTITVPAVVLVILAAVVMGMYRMGISARDLESQKKKAEPEQKKAIEMRENLYRNQATLGEIRGWKKTRVDWCCRLYELQKMRTPHVQFNRVHISHKSGMDENNTPSRIFRMEINGRAEGETAEREVNGFRDAMKSHPTFGSEIDEVSLTGGRDPARDAGPDDRVFQLVCDYKPRSVE